MSDGTPKHVFDYKETAEALIKARGIHEGVWKVSFHIASAIATVSPGPSGEKNIPALIATVSKVGLVHAKEDEERAVDAAKVNPAAEGIASGTKRIVRRYKVKGGSQTEAK